jgi:hypothetical protein
MPGQPPTGKKPASLIDEFDARDPAASRWQAGERDGGLGAAGAKPGPKTGLKAGAIGVSEHLGVYGRGRYAGATGEGERVGVKGVSVEFEQPGTRLAGDALTGERPGTGIGVHGVSGAGTGVRGDSRTGVGVAGKSRSVAGIEGQSEHDVGGVFVSATQAQLRLYPTMRQLPDTGRAGDLLALLSEDSTLDAQRAELWFCVRASFEHNKAVWKRVSFDATWPPDSVDE